MELERYRALLCAIETGSLSAAAEKLGYTPSGVSRMMASLEDEMGFPLLLRGREGVLPTGECRQMLPAIRELLFSGETCQQLASKIRGLDIGTVTIGAAYSAYYGWLSRVTSAFHERYPGIRIQLRSGSSTELLRLMDRHEADLCFISQREGGHVWTPLQRDPLMAWVPGTHPLAAGASVPVSAFSSEPYIDIYPGQDSDNARLFRQLGLHPNTVFSTMDSYAAYAMVEAGLGISMNNHLTPVLPGSVAVLPLDPPQSVTIGLAVPEVTGPATDTFLSFLQPYLAELQPAT